MKAVIMAGGNGIRLRPLTCTLPKPMVKLCGRPVMEHILLLLKKHGFNSVMATLGYMPQEIENYFEGGEKLGISFDCVTEREPRGTAGSVKLCESFIGGEDFLVISGDAVCDFDLEAAAKFHRKNGADVTILTCRNTHPTRYGLVLCDKNGDVEGFLEKPSWNQVFGDQVNTGIYFIKPSVLAEIPENAAFDFAKDLFPKLLKKGSRLTVCEAKGYWCDIGDTDAYLQCVFDILNGDVNIELPAPKTGEGVYMNSVLPSGANIQPPCYIGKNVVIRKGAVIGPYAVIDDGSVIDGGAVVERSVVDKAHIAPNSSLFGAIVSRAAVIREGTGLSEGSVIGEGTVIGEGAVVYEGVRVWPRKLVAPGSHVHYNIMTGSPQNGLSFEGPGILTGEINADMTPEILMGIGSYLGENKECGVGFAGGRAAEMLAGALIAGIEAAGGTAVVTDAKLASAMSFAARLYRFPASVFLKQKESYADIYIFDSNGLLMKKDQRRKMAAAVTRGEISRAAAPQSGGRRDITGLMRSYAATYALVDLGGFSCSVQDTAQNAPLAEALTMCGASVSPAKRKKLPSFELADDGMALCAYDEEGKYADAGHMYVLSAVCAVKNGKGESVTAYFDAPNILEAAVYSCGGKVNRVSRENAGQDTAIRDQTFLRDGVSAALNIALYLITSGESLKSALAAIPDFYTATREIDVSRNRASMMQALLQECAGVKRELCDGVKLCVDSGWVHISPLDRISRLKVTSEGMNSEIAGELCDMFSERLKKLDQRGGTIS